MVLCCCKNKAKDLTTKDEDVSDEDGGGYDANAGRKKSVFSEKYDPEEDSESDNQRVVNPKSDVQRKRLNEAVKNILIFRSLDGEQMNEILDAMFEMKVKPKDNIIEQGDDGDNFFVIESGTFDIFLTTKGQKKKVGTYEGSGSFGELALLYNMPRAATVISTTAGIIWALDRATFRRIVLKSTFKKRKRYEDLIGGVKIFEQLNENERMNICDALHTVEFKPGTQIIKQGDKADQMYFLETGSVSVKILGPDKKEKEISVVKPGGYFGELALVTNKPRAASVYAVGLVKCAALDVQAFERLLGPCVGVMKRNVKLYQEELKNVFGNDGPSMLRL